MRSGTKVEFIESYIKSGGDYTWNDNHGELIRCRDCKNWEDGCKEYGNGVMNPQTEPDDYCSFAEKKEYELGWIPT